MNLIKYISSLSAAILVSAIPVLASSPSDIHGGDSGWEVNLATPAVPPKANASVARHMETIRKWFEARNLNAQVTRKNEVVKIIIPAEELFAPNVTTLKQGSDAILSHFAQAVSNPDSYKVLIAVFTDDTGDTEYSNKISSARAQAVNTALRQLANKAGVAPNIDYYYFGNKKPIKANNSVDNRAQNRRVEIYLVPENKTIEAARSGKLS